MLRAGPFPGHAGLGRAASGAAAAGAPADGRDAVRLRAPAGGRVRAAQSRSRFAVRDDPVSEPPAGRRRRPYSRAPDAVAARGLAGWVRALPAAGPAARGAAGAARRGRAPAAAQIADPYRAHCAVARAVPRRRVHSYGAQPLRAVRVDEKAVDGAVRARGPAAAAAVGAARRSRPRRVCVGDARSALPRLSAPGRRAPGAAILRDPLRGSRRAPARGARRALSAARARRFRRAARAGGGVSRQPRLPAEPALLDGRGTGRDPAPLGGVFRAARLRIGGRAAAARACRFTWPRAAWQAAAMTGRLAGKRALVTAAGQGIGRATALAFAAEGASVVATDIAPEKLAGLAGALIATRRLDVTEDAAIAALAAEIGAVDVLFNCAGFVHHGTILEVTPAEWDASFALNVRAMYMMIRAFLPKMLERGGGSIINVASTVSSLKAAPSRCAYGATKAAVIGLTKSVALDFIDRGSRWAASARPRRWRRSPSISPATRRASRPAPFMSLTAGSRSKAWERGDETVALGAAGPRKTGSSRP